MTSVNDSLMYQGSCNVPTWGRDTSGNVTGLVGPESGYVIHTPAEYDAIRRINESSLGTMYGWAGATVSVNGTPVSGSAGLVNTDLPPRRGDGYAVRLIGDASLRATVAQTFTAVGSGSTFTGVAFWAKVKGRTAGPQTSNIRLGNGTDPFSAKYLGCTVAIPNDGKWHLVFVPKGSLSAVGGFVVGTDTIQSFGVQDRYSGSIGYPGMLYNTEELQLGQFYLNPYSRPKFLIRFDDSLDDCLVDSATFAADGLTQAWNCHSLLARYGFGDKGSLFHLTRRIGTSNATKTFLSAAQMATLAGYGWSHCLQTHQDPVDSANSGAMLMGVLGYTDHTVASVDTSANTITASSAHNISSGTVYWGYPIIFSGTNLPAPLDTATIYWARYSSSTAFTLHPTENDAIANTNTIDLTTTGTAANFTYRYAYSANGSSVIQADLENGIAALTALGYADTARIWAPNQGALNTETRSALIAAGIEIVLGIGRTGSSYNTPAVRHVHMETLGSSVGVSSAQVTDSTLTVPSAIQTDGVATAQNARDYVDAVIAHGGIGSNYHHSLSASNGPVLAAYLDQLRLRSAEGACDVVTAKELRDYLIAAREFGLGVVY